MNGKKQNHLGVSLLAIGMCVSMNAEVQAQGACSASAKAAHQACGFDAKDDYWINYGNCVNTDDKAEKKACIREAREEKQEAKQLCREQRQARADICNSLGQAPYNPVIDPANFLSPAQIAANPNPYFPLIPGMIKVITSGDETITVTVTEDTVDILGVPCVVVRDTVIEDDNLVEDTFDWYAQDSEGNVWYFGELSKNYEEGELVDLDGSWKSGVDGAQPGIIMHAYPQVGTIYRQEYFLGEAEDMAEIVSVTENSESVPAADCSGVCVVSREFLPIEPDVEEYKYYAPGVGFILAIDPESGDREELVELIMP